jgi:hypothetical protein
MAQIGVRPPKNKLAMAVLLSDRRKLSSRCPRLPRNPPQTHHDFTTTKTLIFPKHPSKTQQTSKNSPSTTANNFPCKISA